jgi:hypothetical protein
MPTYTPTDAEVPEGEVVIERGSTPQDIGPRLNRTAAADVRFLMQQGEMVTAPHSLGEPHLQPRAEQAAEDVAGAAGGKRDDDGDRLGWIVLRRDWRCDQHGCKRGGDRSHRQLPHHSDSLGLMVRIG